MKYAIPFFTALLIAPLAVLQGADAMPRKQLQLFIDDHCIENLKGLKRTLHQPKDIEANPVIVPEHPWEHRRIPYGSVLWFPNEGKFKCWYVAMNIYDSRPGGRGYRKEHHVPIHEAAFICYAESVDGVKWTKPKLGLHEFRGSKQNNIVLICPGTHFDSTTVMHLPHDKQWPYRMLTFIGRWPYKEELVKKQWGDPPPFKLKRAGHYSFGSKDGIRWQVLNDNKPTLSANDRSMIWWDPIRRMYAGAAKKSHNKKRAQNYTFSRDMMDWTVPAKQWIHVADERDHPDDEAEAAYCFPYGSQWVGFGEMRRERKGKGWKETKINWELLTSHDGRNWSRPIRGLFFADGAKETWRYQVFKIFANPPIERDDRLLIYYGGKTGTVPVEKGYEPFQAVCLATLRKDGFVSLTAGKKVGELVTKPFVATGDQLLLNVDVHDGGKACVEVLDEGQKTIRGFELSIPLRSQPVSNRGARNGKTKQPVSNHGARDGKSTQAVVWPDDANWSQLAGTKVRLRIQLNKADLYSFWTR